MKIVWDSAGGGFGDLWAGLQLALRRSLSSGEPTYLSRWDNSNMEHDHGATLFQMLRMIDHPAQARVEIVDDPPNSKVCGSPWGSEYFPCKIRWTGSGKSIAYQFDGRSSADQKNPLPGEVDNLLWWASELGIPAIKTGLPLSMEESAEAMARSRLFVGCCSGMSCLAISVGVPVHVIEYGIKVAWWYGPNKVNIHQGMVGFMCSGAL